MHAAARSQAPWLPLLLVVLALLCFFGLNFYGFFAGREAATVHATLEMIRQWDFTLPLFEGKASLNHMPLFHHLQAISFGIFDVSTFSARLPAAISGFLLLLTIYGSAGGISGSPRYGLAALIISGLSLLVVLSTRMATPEIMATMLLFGGTALLLANLYTRERSDIR